MTRWIAVSLLALSPVLLGCAGTQSKMVRVDESTSLSSATRITAEALGAELSRWEGKPVLVTGTHGILYEARQCGGERLCDSAPSHFVQNGQSIIRIVWGDGLRPDGDARVKVHGVVQCPEKTEGVWTGCRLMDARWVDDGGKRLSDAAVAADVSAIRKLPHAFWNRRVRLEGTRVTTSIGGNQCARTAAGCISHTFLSRHGSLPMQGPIPADWGSGANRVIEATVWLSHPQLVQTGIQLRDIRLVR